MARDVSKNCGQQNRSPFIFDRLVRGGPSLKYIIERNSYKVTDIGISKLKKIIFEFEWMFLRVGGGDELVYEKHCLWRIV